MRAIYFVLAVFALVAAGCSEEAIVGPPGPNDPIIYSKHIQPIFANSCATSACHEGSNPQNNLSLVSWDRMMSGSDFGAVVIPFNGRKSHLLQHINTDTSLAPMALPTMPFGRTPLSRDQVLLIKRWIDEGAKNDAGEVALSGDRPRAFVTNQGEDLVTVIDLATQRVARFISVGRLPDNSSPPEAPHNIVMSPDGRVFYVNLIAAGIVEKYDAVTFEKLGSVDVGLSPAQIIINSDGSALYVSNFDLTHVQRFITKVNTTTMTVASNIETGGFAPHGVTFNAGQTSVYTMNAGSDDVSEIEIATGEVKRFIPIVPGEPLQPGTKAKHEPYQSVLANDGNLMFVTCRASGQVRVIDLALGRVIDSITVGSRPLILERTPDGSEIWVPNQGSATVSVINVATRQIVATITGLETQPHAVAFSADGRSAWVTCENQTGTHHHHPIEGSKFPGIVFVVDVATRVLRKDIEVGAFAAGITIRN
ncbi:MAG: beta-propeller fold lactonase family protein [bacterium]|nr:beta-propeller fold lactonase family protein [Candidatus Kapabacteria bacterium]